jgi:multiple sugar transport system ATP-binding protein
MSDVHLEHVCKIYPGGVEAVKDICLQIRDREFIVLVGPSGCGKSTTLRMIAGLEELSSGSISIDGKRVNDVPPKDRDIAMVFQNYALYPHMTVYKNMAFGLKLRGFPRAETVERVQEAAEILGIQDLLHRKPKALSGGQRQRVAVGRAIVRKPKAFLFDEPLSNLDAKLRVQMRTEISRLHHRLESTMIYVTHDQVEAMTMGDRIVVMKDGAIQQVASPLVLYNDPANQFVAGFIGSPPMNFFRGRVARKASGLVFKEGRFDVPIPPGSENLVAPVEGKELVLGVRPEDIRHQEDARASTASATVEVVEQMGAEVIVYLNSGLHAFIARMPAASTAQVGQAMNVYLDMDKACYFDAATGDRVRPA